MVAHQLLSLKFWVIFRPILAVYVGAEIFKVTFLLGLMQAKKKLSAAVDKGIVG